MATSAREGGSGSRERDNRKGSNTSSNPITKKQPALSSSLSANNKHSSSSLDQRKPFSTSTSKPAPNYQKPTISSRLDPSATKTLPRRPTAATSTTTRPSVRRQSMDSHVKVPRSSSSLSSSSTPSKSNTSTSSTSSIKPRGPQRSTSNLVWQKGWIEYLLELMF